MGWMSEPRMSYKRHRFPPQIIAHAVWLYFRFPLSLRLVEELLLERGIVVSYETVRVWAQKFGPDYVRRLKRKKPSRQDIWHLDEVVIAINGEKRYLWRAVDQDGYVLDEIVQIRRNTRVAKRLLERLLRKQGCPPKRKGLNNRAENSHVPVRKRERAMQGFRSWSGLQRFVETFSAVRNHFVPPRSRRSAVTVHLHRLSAMAEWKSVALTAA
jgi:putative transposase